MSLLTYTGRSTTTEVYCTVHVSFTST